MFKTKTTLFLGICLLLSGSVGASSNNDEPASKNLSFNHLRRLGKPECNDGTCRSDCASCPGGLDSSGQPCCVSSSVCGDAVCDLNEDCSSCSTDCGVCCGNSVCDADETCATCPGDCGGCTSPNCQQGGDCRCLDGVAACSVDQDCPDIQIIGPGVCAQGSRGGLACTSDAECPKGKGFSTCSSTTTTSPPLAGTCIDKAQPACCTLWCSQHSILGWALGTNNLDGSGFMKTPHCNDSSYRGTCAVTPLIQSHYTGMSGSLCDDPHNIYAPCESDNVGAVVAHHVAQGTWNACELGEFVVSGEVTADGICHCVGTVADGNGGADTYDGGAGAVPFAKEIWSSGCADNASECDGDLSWCLGYDGFCSI